MAAKQALPTPQAFYLQVPLYQLFTISEEHVLDIGQIEHFGGTVDTYCIWCQRDSVFRRTWGTIWERVPNQTPELTRTLLQDWRFTTELQCSRQLQHELIFYFMVADRTIRKVGQFPSLATLRAAEIGKYRAILGDEQYGELARAVGLAAHDIGIGAFVYLRRIFEGLIEEAH